MPQIGVPRVRLPKSGFFRTLPAAQRNPPTPVYWRRMSPIWFPGMVHADDIDRTRSRRRGWWIAIVATVVATILLLRVQGRLWICSCGEIYLWVNEIQSAHNSQHLADPYSLTHVLHGVAFFWLLALVARRLDGRWSLTVALILESLWEVVENSNYVIERYRETTIALGYEGDTILNAISDIGMAAAGFVISQRIGVLRSIALFVVIEFALALWIRDGLLLNILMLLYPIDAVRVWQAG
jgi:hypothetical protein